MGHASIRFTHQALYGQNELTHSEGRMEYCQRSNNNELHLSITCTVIHDSGAEISYRNSHCLQPDVPKDNGD